MIFEVARVRVETAEPSRKLFINVAGTQVDLPLDEASRLARALDAAVAAQRFYLDNEQFERAYQRGIR